MASALLLTLTALAMLTAAPQPSVRRGQAISAAPGHDNRASAAALPTWFEPNVGQADSSAHLVGRVQGRLVLFGPGEVTLAPCRSGSPLSEHFRHLSLPALPAGNDPTGGRVSYLTGNDPASWRTDVPTFGSVRFAGLYPGVDLAYAGVRGGLESTYTVAPGADPSAISWGYGGAARVSLESSGDLLIRADCTASGQEPKEDAVITAHAPAAWQDTGAARTLVKARFQLGPEGSVGFALGSYDRARPLTIDPTVSYSEHISGGLEPHAIAVDGAGSAYVAGQTAGRGFSPAAAYQPGHSYSFVLKLNPNGTLNYATYLGGSAMAQYPDQASGIAVDRTGDAYVAGITNASSLPGTAGAVQVGCQPPPCGFVTELNPSGTAPLFSTFLGHGTTWTRAITLDDAGDAYLTGYTNDPAFPTPSGYQILPTSPAGSGFVAELSAGGGAIIFSTLLGGTRPGNDITQGLGIAVDSQGHPWVTGDTSSSSYPTTPTAVQGKHKAAGEIMPFLTELTASGGGLLYSSYLGDGRGTGYGVATDCLGAAYASGEVDDASLDLGSTSHGSTATPGIYVYTAKVRDGSAEYLTYTKDATAYGLALDSAGSVYVTGEAGHSFPADEGGFDSAPPDPSVTKPFITKLSPAGWPAEYSDFLGAGANPALGYAVAVDASGAAYVTGIGTGVPPSTTLKDLSQSDNSVPGFMVKVSSPLGPPLTCPTGAPPPPRVSVVPAAVREAPGATAGFGVQLSGPATQPVTVSYATADGTSPSPPGTKAARAGVNYVPSPAGSHITIPTGSTSGTITVPILDEGDSVDPNGTAELFSVNLLGATNATIQVPNAQGSILDTGDTTPPRALVVTGVNPLCGPTAGSPVTISGQNLAANLAVNFDSTAVTATADPTGTVVTVLAPRHAAAKGVSISVTNLGAPAVNASTSYEYSDSCQPAVDPAQARLAALADQVKTGKTGINSVRPGGVGPFTPSPPGGAAASAPVNATASAPVGTPVLQPGAVPSSGGGLAMRGREETSEAAAERVHSMSGLPRDAALPAMALAGGACVLMGCLLMGGRRRSGRCLPCPRRAY